VQDTGVGMAPEVQAHIFEPFFTTKPLGHGTGLGLATSYGIVTQHGGRIAVSSQLGEGSAFLIDLPIVDAPLEELAHPLTSIRLPGGSETILVVEDEAAVRAFVERVLRGLGYVVLSAQHGLEALQLAHRGVSLDVLLTDTVMPELSGVELATRLLAQQPTLRVIYMSGYVEHATLTEEILAQHALLQKPFTPAELARLLREVLGRSA
jgi:two-component system cell cycle sensor histidine kinase/response regulator CckA